MQNKSVRSLDLEAIRGVVADMDGVIWRQEEILPGVPDFFLFLRERHIPYVLATNNSTRSIAEYVTRIDRLGIPIDGDHVVTSAIVTADALAESHPPGTPIYVIGSDSLRALLTARGHVFDPEHAQVVIIGLDFDLTYDKLRIAGQRVLAGADFIGTNGDLTFPSADGLIPGNGSIVAAIEAMTGRKARLMGKPEPVMFRAALKQLGTEASETLMIGDRLDTDIEGAQRAGLLGALVLTGAHRTEDIGAIQPDGVYNSLAALQAEWQRS